MQKCLAFDHAICLHTNKAVTPCCNFIATEYIQYTDNWQEKFAKQGVDSEQGWVPGCDDCEWEDNETGYSLKDRMNENLAGSEGITYFDIKFSNTCNLMCRMCRPADSSIWTQNITDEYTDNYYNIFQQHTWHKEIELVLGQLHKARYLKFTGGEPFLIPHVWQVLDKCIELGIAKNIELLLTTNGTQLKNLDILKQFKSVELLVSVDAVGKRYEYIRPGASWEQVSNNILQMNKEVNTAITALPMIWNKDHRHELDEWGLQNDIEVRWSPPLSNPEHWKIDALERCPDTFIKYAELQDKLHNTNWREWVNA